jgi:hypothetical protein
MDVQKKLDELLDNIVKPLEVSQHLLNLKNETNRRGSNSDNHVVDWNQFEVQVLFLEKFFE